MEKIRVENLNFIYPLNEKKALNNVSLKVYPGDFVLVCGRSGCGKTTLLKHMKKSLVPHGIKEGEVFYDGKAVLELDERINASEIGFVGQNPESQIVTDKVWHELAFGLENLGLSKNTIKRRVAEMASYFGIEKWFRKNTTELSGGEKQLLNLAAIMVMQPSLLILDEPIVGLDPIAGTEFIKTVERINRDLGVTVIISEHHLEEIYPLVDRVIVMENGRIVTEGSPSETGTFLKLTNHPMYNGLPEPLRIFQSSNFAPLTVRDGRKAALSILPTPSSYYKSEEKDLKIIGETVLKAENIWFRYKRKDSDILRGMNLTLEKGSIHSLLGGNGSGKSTFLKIVTGIERPYRGKLKIENNIKIGMVPQNPEALFTEETVLEELLEALNYEKITDDEKIIKMESILSLMELEPFKNSSPFDLSGGEKQRLAVGKIMILEPNLLLLDEPTKGMDPFFRMTFGKLLLKLKEKGVTILMVSHDLEFTAMYSDYAALLFDGETVSFSETHDFFSGNSFYTTVVNRILGPWNRKLITCEEAKRWLKEKQSEN